jgi:hypothetical protein
MGNNITSPKSYFAIACPLSIGEIGTKWHLTLGVRVNPTMQCGGAVCKGSIVSCIKITLMVAVGTHLLPALSSLRKPVMNFGCGLQCSPMPENNHSICYTLACRFQRNSVVLPSPAEYEERGTETQHKNGMQRHIELVFVEIGLFSVFCKARQKPIQRIAG